MGKHLASRAFFLKQLESRATELFKENYAFPDVEAVVHQRISTGMTERLNELLYAYKRVHPGRVDESKDLRVVVDIHHGRVTYSLSDDLGAFLRSLEE